MFSLLRMDFYRIFKSKSLWVCTLLMIGIFSLMMFSMLMLSYMPVDDSFNMSVGDDSGAFIGIESPNEADMAEIEAATTSLSQMSVLDYLGSLSVSGGNVGLFLAIFVALFIAAEFESGFSKNVFSTLRDRRTYFFSKALVLLGVTIFFFLVATATALIGSVLADFELQGAPLVDSLVWAGLSILSFWALSMLVALVAWLTKTKTGALIVGILVTMGLAGSFITMFLGLFDNLTFLQDYLLHASWTALQSGVTALTTPDLVRIACVGGGYLALYSLLSFVVIKKINV